MSERVIELRLQNVHLRINDTATHRPTPCRVRFVDAAGEHHAPFGRSTVFATGANQDVGGQVLLGMKPHAYIDGACEIALPPGPLQVHVSKGPEFVPQTCDVQLVQGKLALRLDIHRWIDLRKEGWYSGDTRAHHLSPHAALLEAQGEDLAVVNLLAAECQVQGPYRKQFPARPNLLAFSGQQPCLEVPGHMVVVNTHNQHPQLGSLGLLNCHRVVYPLTFGGPDGKEDWTLAAWCDQCHRKGGLVVWTNPLHEAEHFRFGEPLADLILGKIDAFEIDFYEDSPFDALPHWYTLLNAGLRVPLVGASGKDSNGVALGAMRTYARLADGESFSYRAWIEAIRAGRTFVTNGPLLTFTVADRGPGGRLSLTGSQTRVPVQAKARSQVPFDQLEILHNGRVVAAASASGQPCEAVIDTDLLLTQGGWLAVRCRGDAQIWQQPANQRIFAHTAPIYVNLTDSLPWRDAASQKALKSDLQAMVQWARTAARCDREGQRDNLVGLFQAALDQFPRAD